MASSLPSSVSSYAAAEIDATNIDTDELARRAMEVGTARAASLVAACKTSDPWEISTQRGATIELDNWNGIGSLTLLGTYADGTITIYPAQIKEMTTDVPLSSATICDLVVAHELAHHEFARKSIDIKNDDIKISSFRGRFWSWLDRFRSGFKTMKTPLEEIAAHTLAGELIECRPLAHPLDLSISNQDSVELKRTNNKLPKSSRGCLSGFDIQEYEDSDKTKSITEYRPADIHETHGSNHHNSES